MASASPWTKCATRSGTARTGRMSPSRSVVSPGAGGSGDRGELEAGPRRGCSGGARPRPTHAPKASGSRVRQTRLRFPVCLRICGKGLRLLTQPQLLGSDRGDACRAAAVPCDSWLRDCLGFPGQTVAMAAFQQESSRVRAVHRELSVSNTEVWTL